MVSNEDLIWWSLIGSLVVVGVYYNYIKPPSATVQPVAPIHTESTSQPVSTESKPWGCVFIPPATAQTDWKYVSCQDRADCESWCNGQTNGSVQRVNPIGPGSTWNPTSPVALPPTAFVQAAPLAVFR